MRKPKKLVLRDGSRFRDVLLRLETYAALVLLLVGPSARQTKRTRRETTAAQESRVARAQLDGAFELHDLPGIRQSSNGAHVCGVRMLDVPRLFDSNDIPR